MTLLQPLALLGLLTLPVIALIHLLRERSRRQSVSSLELWHWLEKELRGPRFRRLPLTWILILQLLAAALLALALAQPRLSLAGPALGPQRLVVVVDTSGSMNARDGRPTRLAQAVSRAAALIATLGQDDSLVLITAGPVARLALDAQHAGTGDVAARLAGLHASGVGSDWAGAFGLAAAAVQPRVTNRIVVFTDGAFDLPSGLDLESLRAPVEWNLVGRSQPNQAVVALASRPTASGAVQVFARVANFADSPAVRTLSLLQDGREVDRQAAALAPSAVVDRVWTLPPGVTSVEVRLSGEDVLPEDDAAAVGVMGSRPIDALLVAAAPDQPDSLALQRALRSLPNLHLTIVAPPNYAAYQPHDLTVFSGWLPAQWPRGGVLVFTPPVGAGLLDVAGRAHASGLQAQPGDALLDEVSFDNVTFGRTMELEAPDWLSPVLRDNRDLGLIWRGAVGPSRIVVFAFALDDSNLVRRPAFPVLMANAVNAVLPPPLPDQVAPGQAVALPSAPVVPVLKLTDPSGGVHTFGDDRPGEFASTVAPGLYRFEGQTTDGETWRAAFGVNAGSPLESDLRLSGQASLPALSAAAAAAREPRPLDLWPLAVLLALALLLVEARLAWR